MKRMWTKNELKEAVKNTQKDISTLVDSQGRERFIEGDITIEEITGITQTYGKWSLSGTHLMIVIAGNCTNSVSFAGGDFAIIDIPEWIYDKIYPTFSNVIASQQFALYNSGDYSSQNTTLSFEKLDTPKKLRIYMPALATSKTRMFRFAFDLLVDNG